MVQGPDVGVVAPRVFAVVPVVCIRLGALDEAQAIAEAKRCMSCGLCFECDNCVVYCPQTAVFKVPKSKSTTGRYVDTDYTKCIGCHICKDVCPTGYIQMGLGE